MAFTNVMRLMNSPLIASNTQADFFAAVLAECALYGVPPDALGLFRDLHAMLGYSKPLAAKQMAALSGPMPAWRTQPNQPRYDRVQDVERLAFHQRALIAFGGGRPGEMVGRAEIVNAVGNLIENDDMPPAYFEIYRWAAIDTLSMIKEISKEAVLVSKERAGEQGWKAIPDEDVVKPGGRLYATYQEICTNIRRDSIAALEREPIKHPRSFLRPWAAEFIRVNAKIREEAVRDNLKDVVALIDEHLTTLHAMFPDLGSYEEELDRRREVVKKMLEDAMS